MEFATHFAANPAATGANIRTGEKFSALKWMHLRMLCGAATNSKIYSIWMDVDVASTQQEELKLLV